MNRSQKPPREELERLYLTEKKSQAEIAAHLGKTQQVISRWLSSYGLQKELEPESIRKRESRERRLQQLRDE